MGVRTVRNFQNKRSVTRLTSSVFPRPANRGLFAEDGAMLQNSILLAIKNQHPLCGLSVFSEVFIRPVPFRPVIPPMFWKVLGQSREFVASLVTSPRAICFLSFVLNTLYFFRAVSSLVGRSSSFLRAIVVSTR
mmetsp:Transcript_18089/g.31215  ORF Transcript_18089/g.31215 Transcript_18089/m.31215 type:complete len:134 (+) Transcript_18089:1378-1779(+)